MRERGDHEPGLVGESLDRVVRSLGGPSARAVGSLFGAWPDIVGERMSAHANPVALHGSTLVVEVDEPGWATQLRFLEGDLKRRLAEGLDGVDIDHVEVRVKRS